MNGPLEEQMRHMIDCEKVCLGVVWVYSLLSQGEMSQSFLLDQTPREGIHNS